MIVNNNKNNKNNNFATKLLIVNLECMPLRHKSSREREKKNNRVRGQQIKVNHK